MAMPTWLWRLLGGSVDESGHQVLGAQDRVEVFEGLPEDAMEIVSALRDEGLDPTDDTYCPAIWPYNSEDPRGRVFVPLSELAEAAAVVHRFPHRGNRMADPGPAVFPGRVVKRRTTPR